MIFSLDLNEFTIPSFWSTVITVEMRITPQGTPTALSSKTAVDAQTVFSLLAYAINSTTF